MNWSDGSTDAMRKISDVANDTTLTARFERLAYTVEYRASGGGRIEGEAIQTVLTGENTKPVIAVADEGYRFVGRSDTVRYDDGNDSGVRNDVVGVQKYDEYGNPYYRLGFIVTAIFEKVVS